MKARGILLLGFVLCTARAADLRIGWFTIDCGGGTSGGEGYGLRGTMGQPDTGMRRGGNLSLFGGFWGGVLALPTPPPQIICPSDFVVSTDPGQCVKSNVIFVATATDYRGTNLPVTCVPPSGSTFLRGVTTVICTATDEATNISTCTFSVTVWDAEPPGLLCPPDIVAGADPGGASRSNVIYAVMATDNCDTDVLVTCVPPSGSTFSNGVTLVRCSATDTAGNSNQCSFTVTVWDSTQPLTLTVALNSSLTLCAPELGTPPALHQWKKNLYVLPEATSPCLTLNSLTVSNGGEYHVVVFSLDADDELEATMTAPVRLIIDVTHSPSGADSFIARTSLVGSKGVVRGTNDAATREAGEPYHAGMPGYRSVWYTWRAPTNGIATFHTRGSTFDTLLAIYTGTDLTNLTSVASDDPRGGFGISEVQFNARWGTDYHVALDAVGWEQGTYVLNWDFEATSDTLPVLRQAPVFQTVRFGETATFSVMAEPTNVTYQWLFNGIPIPGVISSNLVITNVPGTTFTNLVITNVLGGTSSNLVVTNVQFYNLGSYSVRIGQAPRSFETAPVALQMGSCPTAQLYDTVLPPFAACPGAKLLLSRKGSAASGIPLTTNPPTQGFVPVELGQSDSGAGEISGSRDDSRPCDASVSGWKWLPLKPTTDGLLEIDTSQSSVLTVLSVFRVDPKGDVLLTPVACDTNSARRRLRARLCLPVTGGGLYGIAVAASVDAAGIVQVDYRLHASTNNFLFGRLFTKRGIKRIEIKCCTANSPIVLESTNSLDVTRMAGERIFETNGPLNYTEPANNNPSRFYRGFFPEGPSGR